MKTGHNSSKNVAKFNLLETQQQIQITSRWNWNRFNSGNACYRRRKETDIRIDAALFRSTNLPLPYWNN